METRLGADDFGFKIYHLGVDTLCAAARNGTGEHAHTIPVNRFFHFRGQSHHLITALGKGWSKMLILAGEILVYK